MNQIQQFWSENKVNILGWMVVLAVVGGIAAIAINSQTQLTKARQEVLTWRSDDKFRGNADASVVIYEFGDLQCPACANWQTELAQVLQQRGDKVKIVFRHYPLSIHKNAIPAAIAAEAAHRQSKFWEYHDKLYATQAEWSDLTDPTDKFVEYAVSLGMDMQEFKSDMQDEALRQIVDKDAKDGERIGVNATPTFFIGSDEITANNGASDLIKAIDARLK